MKEHQSSSSGHLLTGTVMDCTTEMFDLKEKSRVAYLIY